MIRSQLFQQAGQPLIEQLSQMPQLGEKEALVKIRLCTICGSDLHTFAGRRHGPTPCVLGHEMVGDVVALGSPPPVSLTDRPINVGDRVIWTVADSCWCCPFCAIDLPQKCEKLLKYGHAVVENGHGPLGGLATHCHLKAGTGIVHVPKNVPDEVAAPAMCATATACAATFYGEPYSGAKVAILGAGFLGLTAAAIVSTQEPETLLVVDQNQERLRLSTQFGADRTMLPEELAKADISPEIIIEMTGANAMSSLALEKVRTGGIVVFVGSVFPSEPIPVIMEQIVRRCLTIHGIHNYRPIDLHNALQFLKSHGKKFPFAEAIEKVFPLAEAQQALEYAEQFKPLRVAVKP